tara:strand:- start:7258 stop:7764 length:507 start_codon:yes stop_codon:yes gene_type:complete
MSWQMALMVASTAIQAVQQASAAKAQARNDEINASIAKENALAAKVEAQQQEARRRRAQEELAASNRNAVQYDTYGSESFQAISRRNLSDMEDDLASISYMGAARSRNFESASEAYARNAATSRSAGKMALVKGAVNIGATIGKYGGSSVESTWTGSTSTPMGNYHPY